MATQIYTVGSRQRSRDRITAIMMVVALAAGALYSVDQTGPSSVEQGVVVHNTYQTLDRSGRIDVLIENGVDKGSVVFDNVTPQEAKKISVGDDVQITLTKGRITGWRHGSDVQVVKKAPTL